MRIESPTFTEREMRAFLDEFIDHERGRLADRLEAASARLARLVTGRVLSPSEGGSGRGQDWTGHDVLAHIAVLSKFYGFLTSQVGSGKLTEIDLLSQVQYRDVAGDQLSSLTDDQLLAMAQRDHRRTVDYLRSADATAIQRKATIDTGFFMSAGGIAALPLCAHLEIHLDQLERTLRH